MTALKDITGRRPTWTRYVAWGLTLTWGACATVYFLLVGPAQWEFNGSQPALCYAPFLLPALIPVVILLRSEAVGGVVLMLEAVVWTRILRDEIQQPYQCSVVESVALSSGLLPLTAGCLFLASWCKSRRRRRTDRR